MIVPAAFGPTMSGWNPEPGCLVKSEKLLARPVCLVSFTDSGGFNFGDRKLKIRPPQNASVPLDATPLRH